MRGEGFDAEGQGRRPGPDRRRADQLRPGQGGHQREEPAHPDRDRQLEPAHLVHARAPAWSPRGSTTSPRSTFGGAERTARRRRRPHPPGRTVTSDAVVIPNPAGLHARPAAVLSNLAQKYESDVRLKRGDEQANAKSVMAIMGMEVAKGHKVQVIAHGPDAAQAAAELAEALREGWARRASSRSPTPGCRRPPLAARRGESARGGSDDPNVLLGVAASPGLGVGQGPAGVPRGHRGQGGRRRPAQGAPPAQRRPRPGHGAARDPGEPAQAGRRPRQGRDLRRPPGDPARPGPAGHRVERDRQGQERGLRVAAGLHHVREPARRPRRTSCSRSARPTCATSASACWRR